MATIPSSEEIAKKILEYMVGKFYLRPGGTLQFQSFIKLFNSGLPEDDFWRGIDYAKDKGWILVEDNNVFRLTEEGFKQAPE